MFNKEEHTKEKAEKDEREDLKNENLTLQDENDDLKEKLKEMKAENKALKDRIDEL